MFVMLFIQSNSLWVFARPQSNKMSDCGFYVDSMSLDQSLGIDFYGCVLGLLDEFENMFNRSSIKCCIL